ncbi:methionine ABC transporter ATP-binding protein [Alkaliphilus peptidifermentans]|uniref:D-methionine transport system ATP-binding protein n=1 Tax=Alkaliphilus peptidifermentans DSM 18978 TaxID=1120976 RepID=A0A1G5I158_9FIRM|nr:ATP-binding cassette domain-containing protein [Alkaliphilus peptidifermentans]SCY69865.1 D-methionine transport system ATP-binding protein [Alkaliphilus peptidifermentans DSM 18978]
MILLDNLSKTYESKKVSVGALKNVTLKIEKGDMFGIIGYSGAGKSTLIRCINLLERPDSGKVVINDIDITALSPKSLRKQREKIGMIFQHFNLMNRRNVFDNVAYPLKGKGLNKVQIEEKVIKLLELVGIKDKVYSYPSQLSGGQKQRVAIARALANDPEVLLCDEATSALDPQNTRAILNLLKDINQKLNLTVVIITHQMEVVKEVCNRVAVMENGEVVEKGSILDIFSNPKRGITKEFVANTMGYDNLEDVINQGFLKNSSSYELTVKISFVGQAAGQAFISKISIDYGILANILFGSIESLQGVSFGSLIVSFSGNSAKIHEAIEFLEENNIKVEVLKENGIIKSNNAQCS